MAASFVIVEANYSQDNKNEAFFRNYPKAGGYPDFIILDQNGAFLEKQDTSKLEQGDSYNRKKLIDFARKWRRS